jgi:hypothetical protein
MKIVYCSLNISSLDPLIQLLEKEQIKDYQIIEPVKAKNIIGFPRLNSDVWPGYNAVLIMQFSDDKRANHIIQCIKEYNKKVYNENELVCLCAWTLDDYFYD